MSSIEDDLYTPVREKKVEKFNACPCQNAKTKERVDRGQSLSSERASLCEPCLATCRLAKHRCAALADNDGLSM
jgi:hypothetical protein